MKNLFFALIALVSLSVSAQEMEKDMDMKMDMPMEMDMEMWMPERTEGLVILGTTGKSTVFALEHMGMEYGKITGVLQGNTPKMALTEEEMKMNAGFRGFAPEAALVDGKMYRMVAPVVTPDNFIVVDGDMVCRYDLGVDEGTNMITLVGHWMTK